MEQLKPNFWVRKAQEQDTRNIAELLFLLKSQYASCSEKTLEEFRARYEPAIIESLQSKFNSLWVAERDDFLILGFLSTTQRLVLRLGGRVGVLEEIYVRSDSRRRGIGVALWQAAANELKDMGIRDVEVVTSLAHPGQRPFAEKLGLRWYSSIHRVSLDE